MDLTGENSTRAGIEPATNGLEMQTDFISVISECQSTVFPGRFVPGFTVRNVAKVLNVGTVLGTVKKSG